jgi:hypothetical protein
MNPTQPRGTQAGTWVAAGAINDAGNATAQTTVNPATGRGTATHILTSSAGTGTLTLDEVVRIQPLPPPTPHRLMVEGTWRLVAATGAYADLNDAHGRIYATVDREKDPPEITFVRDGSAE